MICLGISVLANFAVGLVLVGVVVVTHAAGAAGFSSLVDPRVAVAGALGVGSIAACSWLILRLGIFVVGTAVVAGQTVCGILIDAAVSGPTAVHTTTIWAAALVLAAAALSGLASRMPSPAGADLGPS